MDPKFAVHRLVSAFRAEYHMHHVLRVGMGHVPHLRCSASYIPRTQRLRAGLKYAAPPALERRPSRHGAMERGRPQHSGLPAAGRLLPGIFDTVPCAPLGLPCSGRSLDRYEKRGNAKEESEKEKSAGLKTRHYRELGVFQGADQDGTAEERLIQSMVWLPEKGNSCGRAQRFLRTGFHQM